MSGDRGAEAIEQWQTRDREYWDERAGRLEALMRGTPAESPETADEKLLAKVQQREKEYAEWETGQSG